MPLQQLLIIDVFKQSFICVSCHEFESFVVSLLLIVCHRFEIELSSS